MFAIKTEVIDTAADFWDFTAQKTMYGGKLIRQGDQIFVFASEQEGGKGLIATGKVIIASAVPRTPGVAKQTLRVSIKVERTALAKHSLGRTELKPYSTWSDGRPETELNFKFYRQATNKIANISTDTAKYLSSFF